MSVNLPFRHVHSPPFLQSEQLKECNSGFGIGNAEHGMQKFHFALTQFIAIYAQFVDGP